MSVRVTGLYRYPVKSCRGERVDEIAIDERGLVGDRAFMIVDSDGAFLTQREIPRLCQIIPVVEDGQLTLRAPTAPVVTVALRKGAGNCEVIIWGETVRAVDQGDEVARWLTALLGVPARLVGFAEGVARPVDPHYARQPSDQVHFADGFPFLLINQASLADLNERMGAPLPVDRFRPNLVVEGAVAFAEDEWKRLRIGDVLFDVVKPCSRCAITQIDQESASQGKEPLRTLAGYRMTPDKKMLFGQYLIHAGPGTLRAGDTVEIVA